MLNRFYFEAKLDRNYNDIVPFEFSINLKRQENVFVLKCLSQMYNDYVNLSVSRETHIMSFWRN